MSSSSPASGASRAVLVAATEMEPTSPARCRWYRDGRITSRVNMPAPTTTTSIGPLAGGALSDWDLAMDAVLLLYGTRLLVLSAFLIPSNRTTDL